LLLVFDVPPTPLLPPVGGLPPVALTEVPPVPAPPVASPVLVWALLVPNVPPVALTPPELTPPFEEVPPASVESPPIPDCNSLLPPVDALWVPPAAGELELLPLHAIQAVASAHHNQPGLSKRFRGLILSLPIREYDSEVRFEHPV
jgi:hypothetical protein